MTVVRQRRRELDRRRGFSLAEVVVTAAIIVIIIAVALPNVAGYRNRKRITDTATILGSLGLALNDPQEGPTRRGFLQMDSTGTTRKYPQKLSHLTSKIVITGVAGTTDKQCNATTGAVYIGADSIHWNRWAPFTTLNIIPGQGVATPLGWIRDSVIKGSAAAGTVGFVELHMDSLAVSDAQSLDSLIDNVIDPTSGLVRSVASPSVPALRLVRFLVSSPVSVTATGVQVGCP